VPSPGHAVFRMTRHQLSGYRSAATQLLGGGIALALLTWMCVQLQLGLATAGFAYLIVIALLSLMDSLVGPVVLSVVAVGCLNYFFAPPIFSFWVDRLEDLFAIAAFLTTSIIVTGLTAKVRKMAEEARTSQEQWQEVFEHNPVMYFMVDPSGTVLSANAFGAAQLGYTIDELVGQSVLNVFLEEDRELVRKNVAVCFESLGRSHSWEIRKVRKDGTVLWVRENAKAVRQAGNRLIALVACEDITERKRAAEELHKAQTELAHATRLTTLGELTASIAHEVNQPLAAVVTGAEACRRWLDRATPDLDEAHAAVEAIIKDGQRAGEVIRRVRALAHKTDTQKVPLDINDVIKEVITLLQGELLRRQVALQTELEPASSLVIADRVEMQQVIINLVMNGIEAMQPVTDRPRELVIRSRQDEEHQLRVTVKDSGVGIPAENADQVFKAFFTTKSSGMGMGLSICRSIIEAHGGRIWAGPNFPHGAAFNFTVPSRRGKAS
jgi:PAS domain S-box-containing protein